MIGVLDELEVCVDCIFFVANGDLPECEEDAKRVVAAVEARLPNQVVASCTDSCEGPFSHMPCGLCGSKLGGERHRVSVLGDVAEEVCATTASPR